MSQNHIPMEFNFEDIIEPTPRTQPEMKAFDVQLLWASIHRTDDMLRNHNNENKQLQEKLVSMKNLSTQIRKLYESEKENNAKLMLDTQKVNEENRRLQAELDAIRHEQINNEALHGQTVADLEYQLGTVTKNSSAKYVDLCESFVAQALILHTNGLATSSLTKKCAHAREVLKSHNRSFAWTESRSKSKTSRSPTKATKCKYTLTASPTKDVPNTNQPMRVMTSEKGTMCTQTTATRSTCTSAFIRKVDASTNTCADETDTELCAIVQKVLDEMVPLPSYLSPIHEIASIDCVATAACTNGSTQTNLKKYRNQSTITRIQNVRKRVNYIRNDSDPNQSMFNDSLRCIKKEDIASPFGSMSNLHMAQHIAPEMAYDGNRSLQFSHLWNLLGKILSSIADQTFGYQTPASPDPKLMEKLQQIQSMLGMQSAGSPYNDLPNDIAEPCIDLMTDSGDENIPTATLIKESASDCSQDSIRSNDSDRITGNEANNFRTLSALVDDNSVDAAVGNACNVENRPTLQERIHANDEQINNSIEQNDQSQQFKVPKRKLMRSAAVENRIKRKRKTEKKVNLNFFYAFDRI